MRKTMLGLFAALPLSLLGSTGAAEAYPLSLYQYSYPGSSMTMVSGPAGYQGFGYGTSNFGTYTDNYGTTTCVAVGYSVICN